jgi:hypothetical protein
VKVTFGEITEDLSFSGLNNNINCLKLILKILTRFVLSKLKVNIAPITNNPNIPVHHFGKKKELSYASQGDHSGRRKRRITAVNVNVFYRNTSACFTSRFFARIRLPFFLRIFVVLQADVKRRRNTSFYTVYDCFLGPGHLLVHSQNIDYLLIAHISTSYHGFALKHAAVCAHLYNRKSLLKHREKNLSKYTSFIPGHNVKKQNYDQRKKRFLFVFHSCISSIPWQ